jgi:putative addiction module killer protein
MEPYYDWLQKLRDKTTKAKIRRRVSRLELGLYGDYKRLKNGLLELRLCFGPGYRIYFTELGGNVVVLMLAGNKATQQKDIERAYSLLHELRQREKEECHYV